MKKNIDKEYKEIVNAKEMMPCFSNENKRNRKHDYLLYQYRKLDDFWNIIKSDSFWATNARFSNDEEEQRFGREVINTVYHSLGSNSNVNTLGLDDNYIVCFCKEDDKLSQWRGYTPNGGVSLGYDFNMLQLFTILNRHADVEKKGWGRGSVKQYVAAAEVCYLDPRDSKMSDKEYEEYCMNKLGLINPANIEEEIQIAEKEIQKKAPYIKHSGFYEENESRLVFRGDNESLKECIRYRVNADRNMQFPYIIVKSGLPQDKIPDKCLIRIGCIDEESEMEIKNCIIKKIEDKKKGDHLIECCVHRKDDDMNLKEDFCRGCTLRSYHSLNYNKRCRYNLDNEAEYRYHLKSQEGEIIISQGKDQEEIYRIVHACVKEYNSKKTKSIKVWCEGHLPLRKITVGPCKNNESIVVLEAIKHYCRHVYWLEDVEVTCSSIPYRVSI